MGGDEHSRGNAGDGVPFGQYRLLEMLGRGGMGEVWRAWDTRRERMVAIKRLASRWADIPEFRERFRREARAAAGLVSAHVVYIHDFDEIDGQLYIDMRLVPGRDLGVALREAPGGFGVPRAVNLVGQIASGLDVAHRAGLLHRDVKPSNILVEPDRAGEQAYLVDFGIVKVADETSARLTSTGETPGTPAYMAPELFTGDGRATVASDVYALACVLFEMLTGRRPFTSTSVAVLMNQHLHETPPPPSTVAPGLAAFDPVLARALSKDPAARHPSASALADDVANRAAAAVYAMNMAGPPSGPHPPAGRPQYPVAPPTSIPTSYPSAVEQSVPPRRPWWRRRVALGLAALVVVLALAVTAGVVVVTRTPDRPAVVSVPPPSGPERVAVATSSVVNGTVLSPDGRRGFVADASKNIVIVLDAATRAELARVPVGVSPSQMAVSPDSRYLYVTNYGVNDSAPTVSMIDTTTNQVVATIGIVGTHPLGVVLTPDGRTAYVSAYGTLDKPDDRVSIIDTTTRKVVGTVPVGTGPARLAISPDGREVYSGDFGGSEAAGDTVTVIDTQTRRTTTLPSGDLSPSGVVAAPDRRLVYIINQGVTGTPGSVQVLDVDARTVRPLVSTGIGNPRAGAVSPDGRTLVVTNYGLDATPGKTVVVIDTATGTIRRTDTLNGRPNDVGVSPDGNQAWVTTSSPGGLWRIPLY